MCTRDKEGRFLWAKIDWAGPAQGSEAAHTVSRINSGYKGPVR